MDDKGNIMQKDCYRCGYKKAKVIKEDYKYTESGLDNIILKDIPIIVCDSCNSRMPIIPMIYYLHRTIGFALTSKPSNLSSKEIRFLRKVMGLTGIELANKLEVSDITISRWENDKELIGKANDKLLRLFYINFLSPKIKQYKKIVNKVLDMKHVDDHIKHPKMLIQIYESKKEIRCTYDSIFDVIYPHYKIAV